MQAAQPSDFAQLIDRGRKPIGWIESEARKFIAFDSAGAKIGVFKRPVEASNAILGNPAGEVRT
jgi:hypothetical protein